MVGPAGTEAEVNAVGLMTDSRGSTAPATHTHTHKHEHEHTQDLSPTDMEKNKTSRG